MVVLKFIIDAGGRVVIPGLISPFISNISQKLCFNNYIPSRIYITIQLLFMRSEPILIIRAGPLNPGAFLNFKSRNLKAGNFLPGEQEAAY